MIYFQSNTRFDWSQYFFQPCFCGGLATNGGKRVDWPRFLQASSQSDEDWKKVEILFLTTFCRQYLFGPDFCSSLATAQSLTGRGASQLVQRDLPIFNKFFVYLECVALERLPLFVEITLYADQFSNLFIFHSNILAGLKKREKSRFMHSSYSICRRHILWSFQSF